MADTDRGPGQSTPDESDAMEIVNDFNDLNLEIVDERKQRPAEDDGPSIDDFQFESTSVAPKRARPRDEWYTKVLGQELGPFPFDQLIEMVSDKEIGPDDYLRHGTDSPWIAAGEIDGLIPDQATTADSFDAADEDEGDDDFELGPQTHYSEDLPQPSKTKGPVGFQAFGGQINRAQDARPRSKPPGTPTPQDVHPHDVSAQQPPQAEPAAAAESEAAPSEPPPKPKPTKEEREAARKAQIAARLNDWLADKVEADDPIPVEENEEEADPIGSPVTSAAGTGAGAAGYNPYGGPAAGSPYGAAAPNPYAGRVPPKIKKSKSSSGGSMFSGLGSLFSSISMPDSSSVNPKAFIGLGVAALVFALMYLPGMIGGTNDEAIYERFKAIYSQIENARANDPGALSSMRNTLVDEVKQTVEDLEKAGAGADEPLKQQLFWAGRNCLIPLLENPGTGESAYDERFKNHINTAGRMLGDPSVPPVQIVPTEDDPDSPSSTP